MSREESSNEIKRITQRLAAIDLEKQQLEQRLNTLQHIIERNTSEQTERHVDTPKVTASDLFARTGVHIPPKYHRFANVIRKDTQNKRLYVGDKVEVSTKGNKSKYPATVAYFTEFKVTVLFENGLKSSREASSLRITEHYDRRGKPL